MKTHEHKLHYHYIKTCYIRDISFIEGIDYFGNKFYSNDKIKIGSTNKLAYRYVEINHYSVINRTILDKKQETDEDSKSPHIAPIPILF